MYTISALNRQTIKQYECFTFPTYQKQLQQLTSNTIAIGASLFKQPIGLVLAEIPSESEGRVGKVLSLFVKKSHRNKGIATKLLAALEAQLLDRGCQKIELVYMSDKPSTMALEKILSKLNWEKPKSRMLVCKSTTEKIASAPWLQKFKLTSSYTILPWEELVPDCKQKILLQQEEKPWYPNSLDPFKNHEARLEPLNSLCLLYHGDVVGWMITHRLNPETIRYTSLFVRKDLQKIGRAIPLLVEAIRRQVNSDIFNGIWSIERDNLPMINFVKRRFTPYLTSLSETKGTQKSLAPQLN